MADYGIHPPGYRLPNETHLGRVRLQVSDLARSLAYYQGVLGLRVIAESHGRAVLGAQIDDRPLVELDELRGAKPVPRRGRIGLYHFAIRLPDRPSLGRFLAHLEELGEYAGMSDHFVSEAIYLTDPDGLGIEVYADRPRSTWKHHDGQLVMTTVPLDVGSVMQGAAESAEGVTWRGTPPGTVIGHVHLHVGDLEEANAFYRDQLGFEEHTFLLLGMADLHTGGRFPHRMALNVWQGQGAPQPPAGTAGLRHFTIVARDAAGLAAIQSRLEAADVDLEADGDALLARDPSGNRFQLAAA
jgi:catechol 2,3-dioxygenase